MSDPLVVEAMRRLGQSKSRRKRQASRQNGSLGGRPLGVKDLQPRKRSGSQGGQPAPKSGYLAVKSELVREKDEYSQE